jgi:hypothetical protein
MCYREENGEPWVKLLLVTMDGREVVLCDCTCDAAIIKVNLASDTQERETN